MPVNSHINFDLILSFESYKKIVNKNVLAEPWRWDGYITYLLLQPESSTTSLEEKLPLLVEEKTGEWLRNTDQRLVLSLQPLASIHLNSNFSGELKQNGDGKLIFYLQLIAISILLLAWINYISLATAKSLERAREVGVRKALGGERNQLIRQFLAESFLLNVLALLVATGIIVAANWFWPEYGDVPAQLKQLSLQQWTGLICVLVGGSIFSGLYPAFVLSGFSPAIVLKGSFSKTVQGAGVRRILVAIQFVCSLVLVMWIYTARKQIHYIRSHPLGFDANSKLVVRDSEVYDSLYSRSVESFKKEVARLSGVEKVSYIETLPGDMIRTYANGVRRMKADTSDVNSFSYIRVDEHFVDVLGLKIIAGRNFTETSIRRKEIIVNRSAASLLGFSNLEEAIQEEIYFRDDTVRILGVLENFYFNSPKNTLTPLIFQFDPVAGYFYILSVIDNATKNTIENTEKLFGEIFPGQPFQFQFLDEHYEQQYKADRKFEKTLLFFSALSVWITCLGLIGMAAYTTAMRRKEISIRKVLGSSSLEILILLWWDHFKLLAVVSVIAIPVSWYSIQSWLTGFSLRINLSAELFIVPIVLLLFTTLLTVSIQTIRASLANPVDGLRHE